MTCVVDVLQVTGYDYGRHGGHPGPAPQEEDTRLRLLQRQLPQIRAAHLQCHLPRKFIANIFIFFITRKIALS